MDVILKKEYQRKKIMVNFGHGLWSPNGQWSFPDYNLNIQAAAGTIEMTFKVKD